MAFYGRTYTLGSPDNHGLHAPVKKWDTNGGEPGKFTNESGFMSYFEFCQEEDTWTKEYDKIGECPYAYKRNQWVGYEDAQSLRVKMNWMREQKYGGAMIWALDLDDYRGVCGEKDPLFNALVKGLEGYSVRVPPPSELTTTKKPNEWWSPPPSSTTTTTSRPKTTRYTEPTTAKTTTKRPAPPTTVVAVVGSNQPTTTRAPPSKPLDGGDESSCPSDSTGQLLSAFRPHPSDKTQYIWCVNGKEIVLTCPPATEWNNIEKQCVSLDTAAATAAPLPPGTASMAMIEEPHDYTGDSMLIDAAGPEYFESARLYPRQSPQMMSSGGENLVPHSVPPAASGDHYLNHPVGLYEFNPYERPIGDVLFAPGRPIEWF